MMTERKTTMSPEAQRIAIAEACPIKLTQGFVAYVDAEDFDLVRRYTWRVKRNGRTNYAISDTGGRRTWMHKVVLRTNNRIDHIDNDGLNNRRNNLRELSNTDNVRRKRPNAAGTSSYKGVSRNRRMRKWQATINAAISGAVGVVRDYSRCLNAMHEAEKVLNEDQRLRYGTDLIAVCDRDRPKAANTFHLFHATAAQRAEAFLRTLNLWKDDQ